MKNRNAKLKILTIMKILEEKTDDTHYLSIKDIINELEKYGIKADGQMIIIILLHFMKDIMGLVNLEWTVC